MLYVEDVVETSSMLAIGDEYYKSQTKKSQINKRNMLSFFMILPPPYTRKTQIIASDQKKMIEEKTFVTNNHLLVQFSYKTVPYKDSKGRTLRKLEDESESREAFFQLQSKLSKENMENSQKP